MQGIGKMGMKRSCQFGIGILISGILVVTGVLTAAAMVKQAAPMDAGRADVIVIDGLDAFGPLERPAVSFYHDKHTNALAKQNKDCTACHDTVKDKMSPKFKRVQDSDKETVMDIYHNQCIGCHKENPSEDKAGPPVTCGGCHIKNADVNSTWQTIGLDKSLHYRHVKANDKKCESCHHAYNKATKALFYDKGQEGACLYCHKQETEENRISNRLASHESCVGCHQRLTAENKDAGPVQCGGCHDPKQQTLIEKEKDIPRMERNQPDVIFVKTGMESDKNPAAAANRMAPVPFDHKAHEGYNDSCRQCHHASLKSCATCHTVQGSDEGQQIKLAQAMHQKDADSSCVGCHTQQKNKPACLGCHSSIPEGNSLASDASCKSCHMDIPAENPAPETDASADAAETPDQEGSEEPAVVSEDLKKEDAVEGLSAAARLLMSRKRPTQAISVDQIPETVNIKLLSKEYEGAVLPHRKIVQTLANGMKDNGLAGYFHSDPATLCQGCHHNSPASVKPPQCGSCHGRSSEALNLTRPGLMAAYHQQCIQCHDNMGLEKPASRDCTACHAKRK